MPEVVGHKKLNSTTFFSTLIVATLLTGCAQIPSPFIGPGRKSADGSTHSDGKDFCAKVAHAARGDATERFVGATALFITAAGALAGTAAVASQGIPSDTIENGETIPPSAASLVGYFGGTTGLTAVAGLATAGAVVLLDRAGAASDLESAAATGANSKPDDAGVECNAAIAEWSSSRSDAANQLKQAFAERQKEMEARLQVITNDTDGDLIKDDADECPLVKGPNEGKLPGCPFAFSFDGKEDPADFASNVAAVEACKVAHKGEEAKCTATQVKRPKAP